MQTEPAGEALTNAGEEVAHGAPTRAPTPALDNATVATERHGAGSSALGTRAACACALFSGILYFLSFPTVDAWPLAFVAWVPLLVAIRGRTTRRTVILGCVAGFTTNVAGFYWLQSMLRTFSGFSPVFCFFFVLILCAYQGARTAFLAWLYGRGTARGWPAAPVFAAAFVASEVVYPVLFPWYFAASVHQVPLLLQVAELGGPIAVGLVLVAVNLALAELVLARVARRRVTAGTVAAGVAALGVSLAYGASRVGAVDADARAAPKATVGVVQANMGLLEKRNSFDEGLQRHLRASDALFRGGADFVVWSETSVMRPVMDDRYTQDLGRVARAVAGPAVFGAVIVKPVSDARRYAFFNSAVSSTADGAVITRYDKQFLLPFGEYIPFGRQFPSLYELSPNSGRFEPGTSLDPLTLRLHGEDHAVTMLICYEDILPEFTNRSVDRGNPDLLVNITNDAWFGDTPEPWQHLALAQLRAVEHRRFFVRGTNSGVSAVIDPVGRVVAHTSSFKQETIAAPVHFMRTKTIYERIGDAPWFGVALASAIAAFVRRPARRRGSTASV